MPKPHLWLLAGPNGSGKSTYFTRYLKDRIADFVNADLIAAEKGVAVTNEVAWAAKLAADRKRWQLLEAGVSFCSETVFSHQSWLRFIATASERGYHVTLVFVCLDNPELNAARVQYRVEHGGHSVPMDKIEGRYRRALEYCKQAVTMVDSALLFDNSDSDRPYRLVACFGNGALLHAASAPLPAWAKDIVAPTSP
ncbi:MAG: AAA family ATPase [Bryobacteraceae bacterium]